MGTKADFAVTRGDDFASKWNHISRVCGGPRDRNRASYLARWNRSRASTLRLTQPRSLLLSNLPGRGAKNCVFQYPFQFRWSQLHYPGTQGRHTRWPRHLRSEDQAAINPPPCHTFTYSGITSRRRLELTQHTEATARHLPRGMHDFPGRQTSYEAPTRRWSADDFLCQPPGAHNGDHRALELTEQRYPAWNPRRWGPVDLGDSFRLRN